MDDEHLGLHTHQPADERLEPPESFVAQANVTDEGIYQTFDDTWPDIWDCAGELLTWEREYESVFDEETNEWFVGGTLNAASVCLDRHLEDRKNQLALVWEGLLGETRTYTYLELYREVNRFAGVLKELGVEEGDVVTLHMPVTPELVVGMLACARIGAPHSVVYAGYSANALATRMSEADSDVLVTCDGYHRRGGAVTLKNKTDTARMNVDGDVTTIVVDRLGEEYEPVLGDNEYDYEEIRERHSETKVEPVERDANDELFLIYTSGTTGQPKRVTQTTGGYLAYTAWTSHAVLDLEPGDTHWCTADIGWITGHSYLVYGPLALGTTVLAHEGRPEYPSKTRVWELIERHAVDVFYTSPSTIRTLMKRGAEYPDSYDLSSLRLLGTVGESISPRTWEWYYEHVGDESCPIVDTWWQTETGGHLITTLPGVNDMKPGAAGPPLPGISATVVDEDGDPVEPGNGGYLVVDRPWPGMPRELSTGERWATQHGPPSLSEFEWAYSTEDGALVDEDGYVTILGRVDDVLKVSGYRLGTMELESAILDVDGVVEAAVVSGVLDDHEQGLCAYVTLEDESEASEQLREEIRTAVERVVGPFASPERVVIAPELPKTSSGKILRRLLSDIANDEELGDTSSLRNPEVLGELETAADSE